MEVVWEEAVGSLPGLSLPVLEEEMAAIPVRGGCDGCAAAAWVEDEVAGPAAGRLGGPPALMRRETGDPGLEPVARRAGGRGAAALEVEAGGAVVFCSFASRVAEAG